MTVIAALTQHPFNTHKPYLYHVCLAGALLSVSVSFLLAEVWQGHGIFPSHTLGTLTILQFSLLACCMLGCWWFGPINPSSNDYRYLIIIAVMARLVLIPVEPFTSNDMARYLFDGRLAVEGYDPWRISHDTPGLETLRALWQPPPEHAAYVTVYPPIALLLFSVAAVSGPELAPLVWKCLVTGASIATLWICFSVLTQAKRLHHFPLVALSPLLILEAGVGAHLDSFSTLAVSTAVLAWQKQRWVFCGIFIGLGALTKLLPVLLVVPLFFFLRNARQGFTLAASTLATLASGYGITLWLGFVPFGSLAVFLQKWRFGSPVFALLEPQLPAAVLAIVIATCSILGLLIIAYWAWRLGEHKRKNHQHTTDTPTHAMQWALALPLIFGPVVFPWYLMPLVPLLALRPSAFLLAWTCLLPLTYEVLGLFACCQQWQPEVWPLVVIGAGFGVSVLVEASLEKARELEKRHPKKDPKEQS